MNKVIVSGNLCKDVEVKYTTSNIPVVQNTIAIRNDYKNANGEYDSQFVSFVAWKHNAQFLQKYTKKGQKILLEGKLITRNYDDKDGIKRYVTEINVEKVELLGYKKEDEQEPNKTQQNNTMSPYDFEAPRNNDIDDMFGDSVQIDDNFLE